MILLSPILKYTRFIPSILKWYAFRATGRSFPLIANLSVTGQCNLRCSLCYLNHDSKSGPMDPALFRRVVSEFSSLGTCYLYLSGGEPLLVKDIDKWVAFAKSRIPFVHLVTNGQCLDGEQAAKLGRAGLDMISISFDGDEAIHDRLRNRPGAFRRALEALKHAVSHMPHTRIVAAIQAAPWNAGSLSHLRELCRRHGVEQRLTMTVAYPLVWGSPTIQEMCQNPTIEDLQTLEKHIRDCRNGAFGFHDPFLDLIPQYYRRLPTGGKLNHRIFNRPCPIPFYYVNVLENGSLFPCPGVKSDLYLGTGLVDGGFSCQNDGVGNVFDRPAYRKMQRSLRDCRECTKYPASCYIRARIHFPLGNLLKYRLLAPTILHRDELSTRKMSSTLQNNDLRNS